ncbi:hypothetical protein D3C73_604490 [compost metagenome]
MRRDIGEQLPSLAERFVAEFLGIVVDLECLRVEAVCLMDGAADEIAARTALVGTVIDELARIGLDPGDERVPGFWRVGRLQLGRVIGEQNLRTAVRQAVFAFDGKRIDLGIVGKTGSLDVGVNAGLDGAGRQKSVGGFEIVGLRIGIGLLGGDCALADRDDAGTIACIDEVELEARIGSLECGLNNVCPEIENVGVRAGVPVDLALGGKAHARSQSKTGGGTGCGHHKSTAFHLYLRFSRASKIGNRQLNRNMTGGGADR